jgi:hypothetical protein
VHRPLALDGGPLVLDSGRRPNSSLQALATTLAAFDCYGQRTVQKNTGLVIAMDDQARLIARC